MLRFLPEFEFKGPVNLGILCSLAPSFDLQPLLFDMGGSSIWLTRKEHIKIWLTCHVALF
jgi:hypothetical protein